MFSMKVSKRKEFYVLGVLLLILFWYIFFKEHRSIPRQQALEAVESVEFDVLLIDLEVLRRIHNGSFFFLPGDRLKLATDVRNRLNYSEMTGNIGFFSKSNIEMSFFINSTETDYFEFATPKSIIPKRFPMRRMGHLLIPENIPMFIEFWKRSKFIDCLNIDMKRGSSESSRQKAIAWSSIMALLRDELLSFGTFPFLHFGTLLGWYRECTFIPHTHDMDLAVFAENVSPEYLVMMFHDKSPLFKLRRKLGTVNDSFELTVELRSWQVNIDLFFMYKENDSHWVGGMRSRDGQKFKYIYEPAYDPYCAADLHGRIFWVSCSPELRLEKDYGKDWALDAPTSTYNWTGTGVENGKWTQEQMERMML